MKIYLSSVIGKKVMPQDNRGGGMKIYLAGITSRLWLLGGAETMNIYLAGGISGNLSVLWKKIGGMKIYLAGEHPVKNGKYAVGGGQILESYYYAKNNEWLDRIIPTLDSFLLDSGAFSFMQGSKSIVDFDEYIEGYAEYIKRNNIEHFFELDIDSVIGLKEVERLRKKLQELTGKYPIPVWHKNRGLDYFKKMCKEYPYVALGGIAGKEIKLDSYEKAFPWFINEAHSAGVKIHGLGYTRIKGLFQYHFDSVDSTAWLYGNRGGYLYIFNEVTGEMKQFRAEGTNRLLPHESALHNYQEWCKFQRYAEKNL